MKKIVILLVLLVLLLGILIGLAYADLRVRGLAETHAEEQIARRLPMVEGVEVGLDGFPFTPGVLLRGEVEALHVKIARVEEQGLAADELSLDVETIRLDKDALIDEQRLVITSTGRVTVQGYVSDEAVAALVKREVEFTPGKVHATIQGRRFEAKIAVQGRLVQLSAPIPGVPPLVFPLPSDDVLPCEPQLELLQGRLRLSCTVDALPDELLEALAQG